MNTLRWSVQTEKHCGIKLFLGRLTLWPALWLVQMQGFLRLSRKSSWLASAWMISLGAQSSDSFTSWNFARTSWKKRSRNLQVCSQNSLGFGPPFAQTSSWSFHETAAMVQLFSITSLHLAFLVRNLPLSLEMGKLCQCYQPSSTWMAQLHVTLGAHKASKRTYQV